MSSNLILSAILLRSSSFAGLAQSPTRSKMPSEALAQEGGRIITIIVLPIYSALTG